MKTVDSTIQDSIAQLQRPDANRKARQRAVAILATLAGSEETNHTVQAYRMQLCEMFPNPPAATRRDLVRVLERVPCMPAARVLYRAARSDPDPGVREAAGASKAVVFSQLRAMAPKPNRGSRAVHHAR